MPDGLTSHALHLPSTHEVVFMQLYAVWVACNHAPRVAYAPTAQIFEVSTNMVCTYVDMFCGENPRGLQETSRVSSSFDCPCFCAAPLAHRFLKIK